MYQLMTVAIVDGEPQGIGTLHYEHVPRIGEWIEILEDNKPPLVYQVLMILHGTMPDHAAVGESYLIYVKRLGSRSALLRTLE